jgi:hypothetical protein
MKYLNWFYVKSVMYKLLKIKVKSDVNGNHAINTRFKCCVFTNRCKYGKMLYDVRLLKVWQDLVCKSGNCQTHGILFGH